MAEETRVKGGGGLGDIIVVLMEEEGLSPIGKGRCVFVPGLPEDSSVTEAVLAETASDAGKLGAGRNGIYIRK